MKKTGIHIEGDLHPEKYHDLERKCALDVLFPDATFVQTLEQNI